MENELEGINIVGDEETNTGEFVKENGKPELEDPSTSLDMSGIHITDEKEEFVLENNIYRDESEEPKKKRSHPGQKERNTRILAEKEAQINQLLAEKEYFMQQAQEAQYRAQHSNMVAAHQEQVATINHETALLTRIETARNDLKNAMDESDADKVADLTITIASATNQLQDLERKKNRLESLQQQSQYYQPQEAYDNSPPPPRERDFQFEEEDEDEDDEIDDMVDDLYISNPWLDPDNPKHYVPALRNKFLREANALAQKYGLDGKKEYVGSKDFLFEVADSVRKKVDSKLGLVKPSQSQRSTNMVAPVGRGGSGFSSPGKPNLSRAEAETLITAIKSHDLLTSDKTPAQLAIEYNKQKEFLRSQGRVGTIVPLMHRGR